MSVCQKYYKWLYLDYPYISQKYLNKYYHKILFKDLKHINI